MTSIPTIEQLTQDILACTKCGDETVKVLKNGTERRSAVVKIRKGAISLTESSREPVPGSGAKNAKYLFIGEAPGADEDGEGEPFIGRSGKLLRRLIKVAGIDMEDCRLTNIVKCHPFRNRNPYVSEIKACFPFIEREIELANPEVIFLLGATAIHTLLPEVNLKANHGTVFEKDGRLYVPMYHPAATFRGTPLMIVEDAFRDVLGVIQESIDAKGLKKPDTTNYYLINNPMQLSMMIQRLEEVDEFSLDIETDESEWARGRDTVDPITNELIGIGISWRTVIGETTSRYIPLHYYADNTVSPEDFDSHDWDEVRHRVCVALSSLCNHKRVYIHNAKFEMESLQKYRLKFDNPWCTLLASYTVREPTLGLKDIVRRRFHVDMSELTDFVDMKKDVVSSGNLTDLYEYGCADAEYCLLLGEELSKEIDSTPDFKKFFYDVAMPLLPWSVDVEMKGIEVDLAKGEEIRPYFENKIRDTVELLRDLAFDDDYNPNSAQQNSKLLFEELGLPKTQETSPGSNQWSTGKDDIKELIGLHPIVKPLTELGSLVTIKSTFIDGLPTAIHPVTGRLHPSIVQTSTLTSRLSYRKPNGQNIPIRDVMGKRIREEFVADEVGWYIAAVDYSQIELRVAADYSQDTRMMQVFRDGLSIHAETCRAVYGIEPDHPDWPLMYKNSKNGNFLCLYEGEAKKLAKTMECPLSVARRFLVGHHNMYPGWWKQTGIFKRKAKRLGYAETLFGFRRYLPELESDKQSQRREGERYAINEPIQGTAANIIQIAMAQIFRWMEEREFESRMILQVHDELVFSVKPSEVDELMEGVVEIMESAVELSIPTPVEVEIGPSWGELEDFGEWQRNHKKEAVYT